MSTRGSRILVIGGGVFGLTAAVELRRGGAHVELVEPGPLPHPLAASTDVSKVVRLEYGSDELYMALMEEARDGWLAWNERWSAERRDALYHETGVLMLCRDAMKSGGFEHESFRLLRRRGHDPVRMDSASISARFPAWSTGRFVDGFHHAKGGYAESGRVVEALDVWARELGVTLRLGERLEALLIEGRAHAGPAPHGRVTGARLTSAAGSEDVAADAVVVATGAWAGQVVPELGNAIRPTGHPVFHLRPESPEDFRADVFPTFTADVARTGYYGFPLNRDGVVKIGNHGVGVSIDADAPRHVPEDEHARLREFLAETFPGLVSAKIVYTRLCLYADTQDEDLWIAADPNRPGLVVTGGGSGHGFKFAPVLGSLTADALEGAPSPYLDRFRWRPERQLERGREAARCHER